MPACALISVLSALLLTVPAGTSVLRHRQVAFATRLPLRSLPRLSSGLIRMGPYDQVGERPKLSRATDKRPPVGRPQQQQQQQHQIETRRPGTNTKPGQQQYSEQPSSAPMQQQGSGWGGWLVPAAGVAVAGAGAVAAIKYIVKYQEEVMGDFCWNIMQLHGSSQEEIKQCVKEYKWKLGPKLKRPEMYKNFVRDLTTNQPIGAASVKMLRVVQAAIGIKDKQAVDILTEMAVELKEKPSVLGKLVFLAERSLPSKSMVSAIRDMFPYSAEVVEDIQDALLYTTYKSSVLANPDASSPPQDYIDLDMTASQAQEFFQRALEEEAAEKRRLEEEAALKAQEEEERLRYEAMVARAAGGTGDGFNPGFDQPAEETNNAPNDVKMSADTHAYECSKCQYTLFPAAGREFKFFGDDFKCPQCGAPKSDFVEASE